MTLEEAKNKYSIDVPNDEIFYSKEYQDYFKENPTTLNLVYEKYRKFQEIYRKSFLVTFGGNIQNKSNTERLAIVLGGQTGAGKTGLVNLTNREALLQNRNFFLIDDDQYRKFYPYYDEIMTECPEYCTILTAIGSGPVTPKIMKYASDNGLNFIFDGTMKNNRILDTAQLWKDYNITYRVMATSRIESLLSIFERNAYLRRNGFGRLISVEAHDETYSGLETTVEQMENSNNDYNIEIYMRGNKEISLPELIYSPKQQGVYKNAIEALKSGRIRDKSRCISGDVDQRILDLETSGITLTPGEAKELEKLKLVLREEIER